MDEGQARRREERDLRDSEERFRVLAEAAFEGVLIHENGRILDVNRRACELLRCPSENLIGTSILDWLDESSQAQAIENLRGLRDPVIELTGVRADGTRLRMEARARTCVYQSRAARVVAFRDVTDERNAREALRASEERFRVLADAALDGIFIHEDGRILDVNHRACEIMRCAREDVIGTLFLNWLDGSSRARAVANIRERTDQVSELSGLRKDGTPFVVEARARTCEYQGRAVRVAAFRDVTAERAAQEALRASEERYRLLAENVADVLWTMDRNLRLTYISPAVKRLSGFEPDEAMQLTLEEQMTPQSYEAAARAFSEELFREAEDPAERRRSRTLELVGSSRARSVSQ